MIVLITKVWVKPERVSEFKEVFVTMSRETRREPECASYLLFQDMQNADVWYTIGRWNTVEAVHAHMTAKHSTSANAKAMEMLSRDPEFSICEEIC
ncbi:MAG: putative quinol monooxygenase [Syntrophomonadaceae bacterium]